MGNFLSLRLASTLKVLASSSGSFRYSSAVAAMSSISFSHTAARDRAAMPNTRVSASTVSSRSVSGSSGSTIMVLWLLVNWKVPKGARWRRIFLMSTSSKELRFSPFSANSPFLISTISRIGYSFGCFFTRSRSASTKASASLCVLWPLKLRRMDLSITCSGSPMAVSTWERLPLAQAEPLLTQMP